MAQQVKNFDVDGARKAGASDADIATYLAEKSGFKLGEAINAGATYTDIIQHLTGVKPPKEIGVGQTFGESIGRGAADAVSMALGAVPTAAQTVWNETVGRVKPSLQARSPIGIEALREGFSEAFGVPNVSASDYPEEVRPAAVAGEILGGGAATGGMMGMAGLSGNLLAEGAAIGGAATGGAIAETIDPNNPISRFVGEIVGGVASPVNAAIRGGKWFASKGKDLKAAMSEKGREEKAADYLQKILNETGENPEDIIKLLNNSVGIEKPLTSAQRTGSPSLLKLEQLLSSKSSEFTGEVAEAGEAGLLLARNMVQDLVDIGSPQALQIAAKARKAYFDNLLKKRVKVAKNDYAKTVSQLGAGTQKTSKEASLKAYNTLDNALQEARKIETELWGQVPDEIEVPTNTLFDKVIDLQENMLLRTELLPSQIQRELNVLGEISTVGEMRKFRSYLLAQSRKANTEGDFRNKRIYDQLADGILQDLDGLNAPEIQEARDFSRALHESFTEGFGGKALAENRFGERIPPETLLENAFGGSGIKADVQFGQMRGAAEFTDQARQGDEIQAMFGAEMLSAQDSFLRQAANAAKNPDGTYDANKLQSFLDNNEVLLNAFPQLREQLTDARQAKAILDDVSQASERSNDIIAKRAAFATLLDTEFPVMAVNRLITGENPAKSIKQLATMAKKAGQPAVEGLGSSILQTIFDASKRTDGTIDFKMFDDILDNGFAGRVNLKKIIADNKIMSVDQLRNLQGIAKRAKKLQDAIDFNVKFDQLLDDPDGLTDLLLRITGAKLGTMGLVSQTTGSSLIAAQAGSKFMRNWAQKLPATRVTEILERASRDPKFMKMLLKKTKTPKQKAEADKMISAYLVNAGINLIDEENEQ